MYLLAGLGNPGDKYEATRHNIGFMFLDYLAAKHGVVFGDSKWKSETGTVRLAGHAVILVKPLTFMNLSGNAVTQISAYYKIPIDKIVVVHDDLDLELGRVKMVSGRGPGGHNGVRSLIEHLGSKDFARVRIGIGRPQSQQPSSSYVLSKFSSDEQDLLQEIFPRLESGVGIFIEQGIVEAMNNINPVGS